MSKSDTVILYLTFGYAVLGDLLVVAVKAFGS